ncbi:MAG: hypothetical protein E5299_02530 [Burkholderia gladioli]|nr:MAG: hypothetical protein E5299_02530 [Burkholderia gladioli]
MNGLRTSEIRHTVDDANANEDLGRLRVNVTRPETVADEGLEPIHRILGKRSPVVATFLLPFSTTVTGNCINRAITPRGTGHIRWPMNGAPSRGGIEGIALRGAMAAWHGLVS